MEGIGLAPGAAAPPPILKPPPLYPILERKPLELKIDDFSSYLHSIKQEFRQYMKQSPFYLKREHIKSSIDRYSDKYQETPKDKSEETLPWKIEWSFYPKELQLKKKQTTRVKKVKKSEQSSSKGEKRKKKRIIECESDSELSLPTKKQKVTFEDSADNVTAKDKDVLNKLKELEKSDDKDDAKDDDDDKGEAIISGDEEYYDEEIEEEGTDYNQTYFDNGEDFVEEDNLEENEGPYY